MVFFHKMHIATISPNILELLHLTKFHNNFFILSFHNKNDRNTILTQMILNLFYVW